MRAGRRSAVFGNLMLGGAERPCGSGQLALAAGEPGRGGGRTTNGDVLEGARMSLNASQSSGAVWR